MAEPVTLITKQIGSSYTASCYANLFALLHHVGEEAIGKRIMVCSYGSGAASTLFRLTVEGLPDLGRNLEARLAARIAHRPEDFIETTKDYSDAYARFNFCPRERDDLEEGVYVLDRSTAGISATTRGWKAAPKFRFRADHL